MKKYLEASKANLDNPYDIYVPDTPYAPFYVILNVQEEPPKPPSSEDLANTRKIGFSSCMEESIFEEKLFYCRLHYALWKYWNAAITQRLTEYAEHYGATFEEVLKDMLSDMPSRHK